LLPGRYKRYPERVLSKEKVKGRFEEKRKEK
jgi:hypothetical protein